MFPRLGMLEIIISCFVGLIGLGVPIAMLVIVFMIYDKVKKLEQAVKAKNEYPFESKSSSTITAESSN